MLRASLNCYIHSQTLSRGRFNKKRCGEFDLHDPALVTLNYEGHPEEGGQLDAARFPTPPSTNVARLPMSGNPKDGRVSASFAYPTARAIATDMLYALRKRLENAAPDVICVPRHDRS
ncbi:hypothetical protein HPB50_023989 [Hyalomma asiaticum]|uniref:Uncharacterized protein n=1 Tax=Hyalomma asiaticum TaxID=266040 RepID=A0ACB7SC63_HYAAI|nr:hypothetical protein HPB50_023989 [Hyalomma asiaticum]